MADTQGGLARWVVGAGWLSAALFVIGPLLAHFAVVASITGFGLFALGGLLGIVGTILGLFAVLRGTGAARSRALRGFVPSLVVLIAFIALAARGGGHPRINDITTDLSNPPKFVRAPTLPGNNGRDMSYPGVEFARQQQDGYPDLRSVRLPVPADQGFVLVQTTARAMPGWVLTREDTTARVIEGVDTSWLFRFQDDFVIEVRDENGHTVVHMRSKSRDGQGDLGVNAKRIQGFLGRVAGEQGAPQK